MLLGAFDGYAWSYELGAIKPEVEIYQHVLDQLDCGAEKVAMIGDTLEADVLGPAKLGMAGFHLVRYGTPGPQQFTGLREFAARLLGDLRTA